MTRFAFTATASLVAMIAAGAVQAQSVIELDEITAFASLTPTELNRTGATVDVITQEELEARAPERLSDFLVRRPGISASNTGPSGTLSTLRIRGLAGPYIAVRVDGIDVTDPSAPQIFFPFGSLGTTDLSRVEIVKGSQSAIAGTSAIAGVINIETRRADGPGSSVDVQVEAGSYNSLLGSVSVANGLERGETAFTLSRRQTDGFSAAEENSGNTEADGFESTRLSFYGDYDVSDTLTIGLNGFAEDSTGEFDNFQNAPPFLPDDGTFLTEQTDTTTKGLRAFAEFTPGTVSNTVALSYFDVDRFTNFGSGTSEFRGERIKAEYLGSTTLAGGTTLSFGAEAMDETFETSGTPTGDRQTGALFAEANVPVTGAFDVSASLRLDTYSDFGEFASARLAGVYRLPGETILRGVVSNGFRAPSLFEINDPAFGNATLTEEESVNVELGLEQGFANGANVQATVFYTEINDLIDFNFAAGGYVQSDGTTRTRGVEIEAAAPVSEDAGVFAAYTYTNAIGPDGSDLARVPTWDLTLGIEADLTRRLSAIGTMQFVNGISDGEKLPDFAVANLVLDYTINDATEAYLRVENAFDAEYQTTRGYGTSDRAFYVGVRARF